MPFVRAISLMLLVAASLPTTAHAAKEPQADPAAYLQAFNETCRRGFPDLETIARNAVAQGWVERTMRPVDGTADILSAQLPRAFAKSDLMLFLTVPQGGEFKLICQVTGTAGTELSGKDIAAVVSQSLNVGEPTLGPGNPKLDDYALWQVKPGMTVLAGISVYRKRTRSISISVRQARMSNGAQTGPPIGVEEGPPFRDGWDSCQGRPALGAVEAGRSPAGGAPSASRF